MRIHAAVWVAPPLVGLLLCLSAAPSSVSGADSAGRPGRPAAPDKPSTTTTTSKPTVDLNQREVDPHETEAAKKVHTAEFVSNSLPFEAPILHQLQARFASQPHKHHISAMLDEQESYDFSVQLSCVDLLRRIGFESRVYKSTSRDGYVTQIIRIVHPQQRKLNARTTPTVVFYAGQGTSPAAFLVPSMDKHRPVAFENKLAAGETYFEGPHFHNRSLALALANLGFDVWLVPARGVDATNRRRVPAEQISSSSAPNNPLAEWYADVKRKDYWSFSNDDIIKHELRQQLEVVLEQAHCGTFSLITYSNGAYIAFGLLAQEPEFGRRHIEAHIALGPAVFVNKLNPALTSVYALTHLSPPTLPFPDERLDMLARGTFVTVCRSKLVRYSLCKHFLDAFYGHSNLFETFLELKLFDYIARPAPTKYLRQELQTAFAGRMRYYDFGALPNLFLYGQLEPAEYKLSEYKVARTYLVGGGADAIVNKHSIEKLSQELGVKPLQCLTIEGYNHLDLLFGWDVAERVNRPLLEILKDKQMELNYEGPAGYSSAPDLDTERRYGKSERPPERETGEAREEYAADSRGIKPSGQLQPPVSLLGPRAEAAKTTPFASPEASSTTTRATSPKPLTDRPQSKQTARTKPLSVMPRQPQARPAKVDSNARQISGGAQLKLQQSLQVAREAPTQSPTIAASGDGGGGAGAPTTNGLASEQTPRAKPTGDLRGRQKSRDPRAGATHE